MLSNENVIKIEFDTDVGGGLEQAAGQLQSLEKEALLLRLAFGRLKATIADAFAPIAQVALPAIRQLIYAATRGVKFIGEIIAALFGATDGMDKLTESTKQAGKAASSLAGFDQINRLGKATGEDAASAVNTVSTKLSWLQHMVIAKIRELIAPLQKIDLTNLKNALSGLKEAFAPLTRELFSGLEWAWHNLLVPLAAWTMEAALPAFLQTLAAGLGVVDRVIQAAKPGLLWLWETFLQPLAQWTGQVFLGAMQSLKEKLEAIGKWIENNQPLVEKMTAVAAAFLSVWAAKTIAGWLSEAGGLTTFFLGLVWVIGSVAEGLNDLKAGFDGLGQWVKDAANGIIGWINGLLQSVTQGLNDIQQLLTKFSFSFGGVTFGFAFQDYVAPQIPYLAQGAVLPANKPFLAMVGDQRNGTNVEAPLATIQEAVASVMNEQVDAMMAGFEASVGVQKEILEAILGISIGDELIGRAADRYQRKMAVVRGGRV